MKTTIIKKKSAGLMSRLSLVMAITLFSLSCTGQSVWKEPAVMAGKTVFKVDKVGNHFFIRNSNYTSPMETRREYDYTWFEFSYVSLISHEPFSEAFKKAFAAGVVAQLAIANEVISITFNVDERGQILGVFFGLHEDTAVLPEELAILERELLSGAEFVVIGKKLEDLIFHRPSFRIPFSEVLKGEIRDVRYSVNLKNSYPVRE